MREGEKRLSHVRIIKKFFNKKHTVLGVFDLHK